MAIAGTRYLSGYQKLVFRSRSNNVQGGGCGIFIKEGYKINLLSDLSVFIDRVIETQFVEIETRPGNWITVASIYRPNTHPTLTSSEQLDQFLETFENILNLLSNLYTISIQSQPIEQIEAALHTYSR